jgi:hypothetical protein
MGCIPLAPIDSATISANVRLYHLQVLTSRLNLHPERIGVPSTAERRCPTAIGRSRTSFRQAKCTLYASIGSLDYSVCSLGWVEIGAGPEA